VCRCTGWRQRRARRRVAASGDPAASGASLACTDKNSHGAWPVTSASFRSLAATAPTSPNAGVLLSVEDSHLEASAKIAAGPAQLIQRRRGRRRRPRSRSQSATVGREGSRGVEDADWGVAPGEPEWAVAAIGGTRVVVCADQPPCARSVRLFVCRRCLPGSLLDAESGEVDAVGPVDLAADSRGEQLVAG
jgi:hypothetical protein